MQIEYVNHASLYLRGTRTTLLTDPCYSFESNAEAGLTFFPARAIRVEDFGRIDYLYSSHIHLDHSHPATLQRLRDRVETVLLPAERADLETRYRKIGFRNIVLLENGVTLRLRDDLSVTSYWSDPIDSCLVATLDGCTVLHLNDCPLDLEMAQEVGRRHAIDYAFVLYTSAQELYPFLLSRPPEILSALEAEREEASTAAQLQRLAALRPRAVVPYSYTVAYYEPERFHLNGYARFVPATFKQRVQARFPTLECIIVHPGDRIEPSEGATVLIRAHERNDWGDSLPAYLENLRADAAVRCVEGAPFRWGSAAGVEDVLRAHLADRLSDIVVCMFAISLERPHVALHVRGDRDARSYLLDLLEPRVYSGGEGPRPYVEMTVPASLLQNIFDGECDAFMLLYQYRCVFKVDPSAPALAPAAECAMFTDLFVALFNLEAAVATPTG